MTHQNLQEIWEKIYENNSYVGFVKYSSNALKLGHFYSLCIMKLSSFISALVFRVTVVDDSPAAVSTQTSIRKGLYSLGDSSLMGLGGSVCRGHTPF